MEEVLSNMRWVFTYILFPAVVFFLFIILIKLDFTLVRAGRDTAGKVRRSVGAFLPFIVLIFLVVMDKESIQHLASYFATLSMSSKVIGGFTLAAAFMESGKWLDRFDEDALSSAYAMLISSIMAFIILAFIGTFLSGLSLALMAFVVTGSVHIMFRGLPRWFVRMVGWINIPSDDDDDEPRRLRRTRR